MPCAKDERVIEILKEFKGDNEVQGQVTKAFSKKEWYDKWGVHHIPSLIRANSL